MYFKMPCVKKISPTASRTRTMLAGADSDLKRKRKREFIDSSASDYLATKKAYSNFNQLAFFFLHLNHGVKELSSPRASLSDQARALLARVKCGNGTSGQQMAGAIRQGKPQRSSAGRLPKATSRSQRESRAGPRLVRVFTKIILCLLAHGYPDIVRLLGRPPNLHSGPRKKTTMRKLVFSLGLFWLFCLMLPRTLRADGIVLISSGGGQYDY